MKTYIRVLGVVAALLIAGPSLAGCQTLAAISGNKDAATFDERSLTTVEMSYSVILNTVITAGQNGLIDAPTAAKLSPALAAVEAEMKRARALYDLGDTVSGSFATQSVFLQLATVLQLMQSAGVIK